MDSVVAWYNSVAAGVGGSKVMEHERATINFVKAGLLEVALARGFDGPIHGLDIACGRGQDAKKWAHAARFAHVSLASVTIVDVADAALEVAEKSYQSALPGSTHVHALLASACEPRRELARAGSVHVATCFMAMNYMTGTPDALAAFFTNVAACMAPRGVLLLLFTDGRWIMRAAREAARRFPGPDIPDPLVFWMHHRTIRLEVPSALIKNDAPGQNLPYRFCLPGHVDVHEHLAHCGTITRAADPWFVVERSCSLEDAATDLWRTKSHIADSMRLSAPAWYPGMFWTLTMVRR